MSKLKPGTMRPTLAEDAAITATAMQDPDALPYTDEDRAQATSQSAALAGPCRT